MSDERHHVAPAFETELTSAMATLCSPRGGEEGTLSSVSRQAIQHTLLSTSSSTHRLFRFKTQANRVHKAFARFCTKRCSFDLAGVTRLRGK